MSQADRALPLIERIQEDERLRGDLGDTAATALVHWAIEQVQHAAADPQHSDDDLAAIAQAIRSAARGAARSGTEEIAAVIACAETALAGSGVLAPAPASMPEQSVQTVVATIGGVATQAADSVAAAVTTQHEATPPIAGGGAPGATETATRGARAVRRRNRTPPVSPPNRRRWSDRMVQGFRGPRKDV